jgi:hypothetical protein
VVVHEWNSEHGENGEGHKGLDWFRPPESKTLRPVYVVGLWVNGEVPSPYMVNRLGLPFEVGGPSSGSVTN